jgi:hypothetical protein
MLSRILTSSLLLCLTGLLGCGDEAPPPPPSKFDYNLEVKVEDTQGNPLPKVPVTVDGAVVGHTDAAGKFTATLNELEGESLTLAVQPVEGFRYQIDSDTVTETLKTARVGAEKSGVPIFLNVTGESLKKDYFVWFKAVCDADCGGWPVMFNGEEIAKTNELGYAHFSFTEQPNNDVEVEVQTPSGLTPSNPRYAIALDSDSTAYRIAQPFVDPNKPKPRPKKKRKSRKGKKKKGTKKAVVPGKDEFVDPTPKKPANSGDGIDLFAQ